MKIGRLLTGLLLISNICMAEQMYFKDGDVTFDIPETLPERMTQTQYNEKIAQKMRLTKENFNKALEFDHAIIIAANSDLSKMIEIVYVPPYTDNQSTYSKTFSYMLHKLPESEYKSFMKVFKDAVAHRGYRTSNDISIYKTNNETYVSYQGTFDIATPPMLFNAYSTFRGEHGYTMMGYSTAQTNQELIAEMKKLVDTAKFNMSYTDNKSEYEESLKKYNEYNKNNNAVLSKFGLNKSSNYNDLYKTSRDSAKQKEAKVFFDRAEKARHNKDNDTAIKEYTQAIKIYPDYAEAYNGRAKVLLRKKDSSAASLDCLRAIELDNKNPDMYNTAGNIMLYERNYPKALDFYSTAVSINPKDSRFYFNAGLTCMRMKRYDDAIQLFTKVTELNAKDAGAYENIGQAYFEKKELDQALFYIDKSLKINSKRTSAYNLKAFVYRHKNDYQQALDNINIAIKINPSDDFSYLMRSNVLKKMNKHQEALLDINKYIEKNPKDAYALIERGDIYKIIGNKDNAIRDYDEALKLEPNNERLKQKRAEL